MHFPQRAVHTNKESSLQTSFPSRDPYKLQRLPACLWKSSTSASEEQGGLDALYVLLQENTSFVPSLAMCYLPTITLWLWPLSYVFHSNQFCPLFYRTLLGDSNMCSSSQTIAPNMTPNVSRGEPTKTIKEASQCFFKYPEQEGLPIAWTLEIQMQTKVSWRSKLLRNNSAKETNHTSDRFYLEIHRIIE